MTSKIFVLFKSSQNHLTQRSSVDKNNVRLGFFLRLEWQTMYLLFKLLKKTTKCMTFSMHIVTRFYPRLEDKRCEFIQPGSGKDCCLINVLFSVASSLYRLSFTLQSFFY